MLIIILSPFMFLTLSSNTVANIISSLEDNITDNVTDNTTDNNSDNLTPEQIEERLINSIFYGIHDNFSCVDDNDTIKFPRLTRLEACIRDYIPSNRWPILCKEAKAIKALSCNDDQISSLEGLQQFPNLETLIFNVKGTGISDLSPIRFLTKMQVLAISNSNISDIVFLAKMKDLITLDLSGNSVTDLTYIHRMRKLRTLSLDYQAPNYITDISNIASLKGLVNLSLQGNKITSIQPLEELTGLQYLSFRDNRVTTLLPLDNLTNLMGVNFSINLITDISPLENLKKLTTISGNSNKVANLNFVSETTALRDIQFKANRISDIEFTKNLKNLRRLGLDFNTVQNIIPLSELTIKGNLVEVGFSYNCISKDNSRQVRYLDYITNLRLDHQCENYPIDDVVADYHFVVNADIVGAKDVLEPMGITPPPYKETSGVACTFVSSSNNEQAILFSLYILLLVIRYNANRKKYFS